MYPLKLIAPLKDYLWGGDKLKTEWGKKTELTVVAESWELSAHPDGESIVANGEMAGKTLSDVLQAWQGAAGKKAEKFPMFPVLVKLIHSNQNLSIQVHPSDEYAMKHEGQFGKTEMWYIVDAEPGAGIYYGLKRKVSKEEFEKAVSDNKATDLLNFIEVKKGETYFIESGTIHAICAGLLICEIQQNSNITYRVYDYGRLGKDGKPRELHVDKALAVSNLKRQSSRANRTRSLKKIGCTGKKLASCRYFTAYEWETETRYLGFAGPDSFEALTFIEGSGLLDGTEVGKGDTVFIPAGYGAYAVEGKVKFLISKI